MPLRSLAASVLGALFLLSCATSSSSPKLLRPAGLEKYRLTSRYLDDQGGLEQTVLVDFELTTPSQGAEEVVVLEASREPAGQEAAPFEVSGADREAWGGGESSLGRFVLPETFEINDLAPPGVADELFGAIADFVSFVVMQSRGFQVTELRHPGDSVPLPDHRIRWQRPPETVDARIDDRGGRLLLAEVEDDKAILQYLPEPWDVAVLRQIGEMRILLAGEETFHLEATVDHTSGRLLGGRSLKNSADFGVWAPYEGDEAPRRADWPGEPARIVPFRRELVLERIPVP